MIASLDARRHFGPFGMHYQLSWTTLPGLRGLSCSEFRATPAAAPDNERGVAVELVGDAEREEFLRAIEQHFSARRFTNAAEAFDTVKAYAKQWRAERSTSHQSRITSHEA